MEKENVFVMAKGYHTIALKNFELLQKQNQKMMALFLKEMETENKKLDMDYNEWLADTQKALKDYQELMLTGLDYLSDCLEKSNRKPSQDTPE